MTRTWMGSATLAFLVGAGCTAPTGLNVTGGTGSGTSTGGSTGTGTIGGDSGIPCDVAAILTAHCTACHSNPPVAGATGPMLTHADLTAPAKSAAGKTIAELAIDRMKGTIKPRMPPLPGPAVPAADIATFEAWVTAGLPKGMCGADGGAPDPTFQGSPTCPSGSYGPLLNHDNIPDSPVVRGNMDPGQPCVSCHANPQQGGPQLQIAGTVFPTGKVLDLCLPPASVSLTQAQVVITDANGGIHTLAVTSAGNFWTADGDVISTPFAAKVVYQGKERVMVTPQTSGDCNACHTANGAQKAPGRVTLPL